MTAAMTDARPLIVPAEALAEDPAACDAVVAALRAGDLVAVPTETVYGLAADATSPAAVAAIYAAKGRPSFNPLIVHEGSATAASRHGVFDARARLLAEAFWPGPLTLVVPLAPGAAIAPAVTAGLSSVAIRVPRSPAVRRLTEALGRPVAAPSANRSGRVSPTSAADVVADLGDRVAVVVDGGPCPVGVESTIVSLTGPDAVLLRPGGLPADDIEAVLGVPLLRPAADPARPQAPGQLSSHYAPRAKVRLGAVRVLPGEALLAFGPVPPDGAAEAVASENLSPSGDLAEAARHLFAALRRLDASGAATIAVQPLPATGLGEAIADRLRRAAAPRG